MGAPTLGDKIDRCKQIVTLLRRDAEDGTGTLALVEVGQTEWAIGAFAPEEGHIPRLVRAALLQRLLMTVARLHDRAPDVDSLPVAFGLLEDAEVAKGVLVSTGFPAPLDVARQQWMAIKDDERVKRVRLFRTRVLAHSISLKSNFKRPEFWDLVSLSRDTFAVVEALAVATGLASALLKYTRAMYVERASDYWSRLVGRAPP